MKDAKINEGFFERLGRSPEVEAAVTDIATSVAGQARATAPVDTGAYREGIGVEIRRGRGRTVARAVAKDPKSMLVEAKTGNLQRAGRAVKR